MAGFGGMHTTWAGEGAAIAGVENQSKRARQNFGAPREIFDPCEARVHKFKSQALAFGGRAALFLQLGANVQFRVKE